jgi:lipopolysaccharide/colanic/teichoic acid biosynthesis glycosyltransferase
VNSAADANFGASASKRVLPNADALVTSQSGLTAHFIGSAPVPFQPSASRSVKLTLKRLIDIIGSLLALLMLAPLLITVAILVKLSSPGPVFFRQTREGRDGTPFQILKFRSMKLGDGEGVIQTARNDPRITLIGKILRRTSIDELPQLLNVLAGDMSLVGPRPHVAGMRAAGVSYRDLVPYYPQRLQMTPGITGWAQANGLRGPTDNAEKSVARIDHDIAYTQNFSLWLDFKIIILTLKAEFIGGSGN